MRAESRSLHITPCAARDAPRHGIIQYDRLIPWASGGALLPSVTILEKLTTQPPPSTKPFLAAAWGTLFVALASSVLSHYTSARAYEAARERLDIVYGAQQTQESLLQYFRHESRLKWNDRATRVLNLLAALGLLSGVALLGVFAFLNL